MSIETWLAISIFLNFCFGVEGLYWDRDKIKNFGLTRPDHLKSEHLGKLCVIHVYTIGPFGTRT